MRKSRIVAVAVAGVLLVGCASAEAAGGKAPKFSRAAAQRAATKAAPKMLGGPAVIRHTDADGSYTLTYGPEQLVAVNRCSKALALHGDAFGCDMIIQRTLDYEATGSYLQFPFDSDGTETVCGRRLTLSLYRGKRLPDEVIHDPDFGDRRIRVTVPFKKPYKVAVAEFYVGCRPSRSSSCMNEAPAAGRSTRAAYGQPTLGYTSAVRFQRIALRMLDRVDGEVHVEVGPVKVAGTWPLES
jgi:hypothetical protein